MKNTAETVTRNMNFQIGDGKRRRLISDDSGSARESDVVEVGLSDSDDSNSEEPLPPSKPTRKKVSKVLLGFESSEESDEPLATIATSKNSKVNRKISECLSSKKITSTIDDVENQPPLSTNSKKCNNENSDSNSEDPLPPSSKLTREKISDMLLKSESSEDSDEPLAAISTNKKPKLNTKLTKSLSVKKQSRTAKKSNKNNKEKIKEANTNSIPERYLPNGKNKIDGGECINSEDSEEPLFKFTKKKPLKQKARSMQKDQAIYSVRTSDSDDEKPLAAISRNKWPLGKDKTGQKAKSIQGGKAFKTVRTSDSDDDDEKPLANILRNKWALNKEEISVQQDHLTETYHSEDASDVHNVKKSSFSDSDEDPLSVLIKEKPLHGKSNNSSDFKASAAKRDKKEHVSESDSEDSLLKEPSAAVKRKLSSEDKHVSGDDSSSEASEAPSKNLKVDELSSDSENISSVKKSKKHQKSDDEQSSKTGSSDEPLVAIGKKIKTASKGKKEGSSLSKQTRNKNKDGTSDDPAVQRMKKYIRTTGLFVNYSKVLGGCNSKKKKIQRLSEILEEAGMKGKPTLEKCRKLKAKRERQKEVAELDLSNIICGSGRARRNVTSTYNYAESCKDDDRRHIEVKKTFSRLKGIIDSEESD